MQLKTTHFATIAKNLNLNRFFWIMNFNFWWVGILGIFSRLIVVQREEWGQKLWKMSIKEKNNTLLQSFLYKSKHRRRGRYFWIRTLTLFLFSPFVFLCFSIFSSKYIVAKLWEKACRRWSWFFVNFVFTICYIAQRSRLQAWVNPSTFG